MTWAKVDTGFHSNPKIRRAGRNAADVYFFLILANAKNGGDGELPEHYADPAYLAYEIQCSEEEAEDGLKRCETFHLLHVTGGVVTICGWDDEWRLTTSSDRVRKHRKKKKQESQTVTTDETLRNVSGVSCNGETHREIDREIERKKDISLSSGASTGGSQRKSRKRSGPAPKLVAETARTVVAAFNGMFERDLGSKGSEDQVRRLLAKGYTEPQMRGVMWWAGCEWGNDDEWRMKVSPTTLLKLTSSAGARTFPQYLDLASERWREEKKSTPPWEQA